MISGLLSRVRGAAAGTTNYFSGGAKGLAALGMGALTYFTAGRDYGERYGAGFGLAYSAATVAGPLSLPILAGELTHTALAWGNEKYKERRKVNFGSPNLVADPFGTRATMRMRSRENLSRGRAVLGNEARLYHF